MSEISGTFRSSADADKTVSELKKAGFALSQIGIEEAKSDLSVATAREAAPAGTHSQHIIVTVHAGSRTSDARAVLMQCGAYDINEGDEAEKAVHEPVHCDIADTPFGVVGDVANGMT